MKYRIWSVVLALAACSACSLDGADIGHKLGSVDLEQLTCHWTDNGEQYVLPETPEGKCWCIESTRTSVPSAPGNEPCDVDTLPHTYCTTGGAVAVIWSRIGTSAELLPLTEVSCEEIKE